MNPEGTELPGPAHGVVPHCGVWGWAQGCFWTHRF